MTVHIMHNALWNTNWWLCAVSQWNNCLFRVRLSLSKCLFFAFFLCKVVFLPLQYFHKDFCFGAIGPWSMILFNCWSMSCIATVSIFWVICRQLLYLPLQDTSCLYFLLRFAMLSPKTGSSNWFRTISLRNQYFQVWRKTINQGS